MTALTLCEADDLTGAETDALWAQGVCLDDWDYLLVCEDLSRFRVYAGTDADGYDLYLPVTERADADQEIVPEDYNVADLLTGSFSNIWYLADFRGRRCVIGVAYHA